MENKNHLQETDETLVALTLLGRTDAYEQLVCRYQKIVTASAKAITSSIYMAEDAAQDAFVSAWLKLDKLRDPAKYAAWVCRIARNHAKSMMLKYRDCISFEDIIQIEYETGASTLEVYDTDTGDLHERISKLPDKVKTIVDLHYFEGLSIAEIADRMKMPNGTVKWHLHEGRKLIRKDLCAMNEHENDTLVRRVMKKVEELKLWHLKPNGKSFRETYDELLCDIEAMPESREKSSALADTLKLGWWRLKETQNDELFNRMKQAAIDSHNDEVMKTIIGIEDDKVPQGKERIEFMRNKQIPWLEANKYRKSLGREWFWLAYEYFNAGESENGFAALDKVNEVLTPSDVYYSNALSARRNERFAAGRDRTDIKFHTNNVADEYRYIDGELRFWSQPGYRIGGMHDYNETPNYLLYNISRCNKQLFPTSMKPGDSITDADGNSLAYISDTESAMTACGTYENCSLWECRTDKYTYRTWCKPDIGIVRAETEKNGNTEVRTLKEYTITGGKGMVPFCAGNRWVYAGDYDPEYIDFELTFEVTHADDASVILNYDWHIERKAYNENSWDDMIGCIKSGYASYINNSWKLNDVRHQMECAIKAAGTPIERIHALTASDVLERIYRTDPDFTPDTDEKGYWNFFERFDVSKKGGRVKMISDYEYSFEWKDHIKGEAYPLLFNGVYEILRDNTGAIYDEKWQPGYTETIKHKAFRADITTETECVSTGTVTTPAGTFENCITVHIHSTGFTGGLSYIGGEKSYTYAPGIGIVRAVSKWSGGERECAYDLVSYTGTGEGMMPIGDGFTRRFEAQNLSEGYIGAVEYTYCEDKGRMYIFHNKTGIQKINK